METHRSSITLQTVCMLVGVGGEEREGEIDIGRLRESRVSVSAFDFSLN